MTQYEIKNIINENTKINIIAKSKPALNKIDISRSIVIIHLNDATRANIPKKKEPNPVIKISTWEATNDLFLILNLSIL